MKTFRFVKRFDPETGKPTAPVLTDNAVVLCDYSGQPIGGEGHQVEYAITDVSGCEEFWDSDEVLIGKRRVDIRELVETQPTFAFHPAIRSQKYPDMAYNAEVLLALEWASERNAGIRKQSMLWKKSPEYKPDATDEKKESLLDSADKLRDEQLDIVLKELGLTRMPELGECQTFAQAMHMARYRVIRKLLAGKTKPETLGIKFVDERD